MSAARESFDSSLPLSIRMGASGILFDLGAPSPADVRLEDVAHHLARICRFVGGCGRTISVAEHALLVSDLMEADGRSTEERLFGLHHDDAEAYVGDSSSPLKRLIPELRFVEARVFDAVAAALRLPDSRARCWEVVQPYDRAAYLLESRRWVLRGDLPPDDPYLALPAHLRAVPLPFDDFGLLGARRDEDRRAGIWLDEHRKLKS